MFDKEFREWLMRSELADAMSRRAEELSSTPEAEVDSSGLIDCPLLPLRDMVMFPRMVTPLFVGREKTLAAITHAGERHQTVIAAAQLDPETQDPGPDDFYSVGTELAVGRVLRLPDGATSVLGQGRRRVEIVEILPGDPYFRVRARPVYEPTERPRETEALMRAVLALFEKCVHLNRNLPEESYIFALNVDEPGWLSDLIASVLNIPVQERQSVLETFDPTVRLQRISILLGKELDVLELEDQITSQVQNEVDRGQREMYLREQMKSIQTELGESDAWSAEISELRDKVAGAGMPEEVHARAMKELDRLTQMPPLSPEVSILRTYLDWLIELPWWEATKDNQDLEHAAAVLDRKHYGLPKAKERILEYIAVKQLTEGSRSARSPILCFVGPPGTGKTSLGRSIAEALGRKFVRVSLGGVRDEAEIRGHRRTYIGALPGRIIQTMRRSGAVNPLFMLDEIDKLGQDFRGDPSAALLEVLDPEQNHAFSDHYLEVNYDLSRVLFITTANTLNATPPALQDRLEVIEFPGYLEEEKLEIARQFLIPRQLEENGLGAGALVFSDAALKMMVREYTWEAGVRNLERELARVCRKVARRKAEGKPLPARVLPHQIHKYLGPPQFSLNEKEKEDEVGVATLVAVTDAGGDTMPVEVTLMEGKGNLQITGQIGEVMQESAQAAMSFLRSRAREWNIPSRRFEKTDVHIHIPEGAVPKDGPSAGVTIATALISAFTSRKVRKDVGMTGELTLRGRVLPIGGVREKVLAAHRIGIKTFILPFKNAKDLEEVPRKARTELKLVLVRDMDEVLKIALLPAVERPVTLRKKPEALHRRGHPQGSRRPPGLRPPAN